MRDKVSVVIPTYNSSNSIIETLESVLKQTYNNIEIIIVDDLSDDFSVLEKKCHALFDDYNFKNYILYRSSVKLLGGGARNKGVELSKGKFIAFLDSDDIWFYDKLEKQIEFKLNNPHVDLVYTKVLRGNDINTSRSLPKWGIGTNNVSDYLFILNGVIQTSSILIEKDLFEIVKFNSDLKRHQDIDFCIRADSKGIKFGFINENLVHWVEEAGFDVSKKGESYEFCKNWIMDLRPLCSEKSVMFYMARSLASNAIKNKSLHIYIKDTYNNFGIICFCKIIFIFLKWNFGKLFK